MDTLRDLEIINGTHGSDAEAAFAKVSKDVEELRYACGKSPAKEPCDSRKRPTCSDLMELLSACMRKEP